MHVAEPVGTPSGNQTIPGQSTADASPPAADNGSVQTQVAAPLFKTTPHNPVTTEFAALDSVANEPVPSLDRMRFASAATERIASGISIEEVVAGLGEAAVPQFADGILVYLRQPLQDYESLRLDDVRLAHHQQAPSSSPDAIPQTLPAPEEDMSVAVDGALAELLSNVRPVLVDDALSEAALTEITGRSLPDRSSALIAPLQSKRQLFGFAVLVRRRHTPFDDADLLVAAQMATHTALGIDRALLVRSQAYVMDELQRTMLPETLAQPTGVQLASRYLPATETARVGGDWYDSIPLPGSRVALVIGDVMGHTNVSAAIMGQLRTSLQTLAGLDLPPQEVLHHLDEQAQRLGPNHMATCMYAVYDPVAHKLAIANAGHPPPILLHANHRAEVLRVPPAAPIGVGGVYFEAVEVDAPAGATLLMYTDGLVESRTRDVWTGIEHLREQLSAVGRLAGSTQPPPLEAVCDSVLNELGGPGDSVREDDIALLAARFNGIAPSNIAYWFLEPDDSSPRRARHLARRALKHWDLEELTDRVELLVSEIVTNAVRYASHPVTLRLLRTNALRCEVADDVPSLPRARLTDPLDEAGRGLIVVNKLARRWGATRLSTGKVVWFEIALP
ncbi:SpoIIE family protein phosphatase [Streptomyces mirabilis]|uniref:SpoIIE family protein phosphatase n=1 Tax=Streptomyces mirabilis TaxID=68239 RepID=UPI003318527D